MIKEQTQSENYFYEMEKNLEYFERNVLYMWLEQHPDLKEIYHFKEAMHSFYRILNLRLLVKA